MGQFQLDLVRLRAELYECIYECITNGNSAAKIKSELGGKYNLWNQYLVYKHDEMTRHGAVEVEAFCMPSQRRCSRCEAQ